MFFDLDVLMRERQPLVGSWILMNDPFGVDMMAGAGFDFLVVDMEHVPFTLADVRQILLAIGPRCPTIVRVRGAQSEHIEPLLDFGAAGIMIPRVRSVDEVRTAVEASKYYPLGHRGQAPIRVSGYFEHLDEVWAKANQKQLLIVQIEHIDAVNCLDEILKVEGVDGYFMGFADLSQSVGQLGDWFTDETMAMCFDLIRRIAAEGKPVGMSCYSEEVLRKTMTLGGFLNSWGADIFYFQDGLRSALDVRRKMLGGQDTNQAAGTGPSRAV